MYCFRIFESSGSRVIPMQEPLLTAGSARENDMVLTGSGIPGLAFRLSETGSGISFASASPQCKASLNGKRTESATLRMGDRLEIGDTVLILDGCPSPENGGAAHTGPARDFHAGLTRLCGLVAEERDLKVLLEKTMRMMLEHFRGDEAFVFTLDEAGAATVFVSTRGEADPRPLFSDTIVAKVLREKRGLYVANALSSAEFSRSESITALKLHSVLCCPIIAGGKATGLLYMGSGRPSISFDGKDLREMEIYAMVAGCLIHHVEFISAQKRQLDALRLPSGAGMVAASPVMQPVLKEAVAVAAGDISVLLQGETGTGKDVLAQFIHNQGRRKAKPFLVVNCSTLRGELLASELFGHRKGAFTGALQDQPGLFLAADGGTLFLDEIGEMDLPLQAMLLRTLETGKVRPVGQTAEIATDVRILCATNRDLKDMIAKGTFRQDLYYRINQHAIRLPPLRERGEDILLLARHYLEKAKALYPDKRIEGFHPDSLSAMARYAWPGNIRELANAVNKSVLFADSPAVRLSFGQEQGGWVDFDEATRRFQQDYLLKALEICGGDKEKAAEMLGMGRSTFFRHLAAARGEEKIQG